MKRTVQTITRIILLMQLLRLIHLGFLPLADSPSSKGTPSTKWQQDSLTPTGFCSLLSAQPDIPATTISRMWCFWQLPAVLHEDPERVKFKYETRGWENSLFLILSCLLGAAKVSHLWASGSCSPNKTPEGNDNQHKQDSQRPSQVPRTSACYTDWGWD